MHFFKCSQNNVIHKQNSIKNSKNCICMYKTWLPTQENSNSKQSSSKQVQEDGKRRRRREDWRESEEEGGGGKKKEKADVLEPEKCPLPREVGPFFPLLTGGENIYKTNRAHITSESTDTADSKTHLYRNINAATHEKLHSKTPGQ